MLFLIDYESENQLLHTLTGYTYIKNNNGPYTKAFKEDLERLKKRYVSEKPRETFNGGRTYYLYDLVKKIKSQDIIKTAEEKRWFSQEEQDIVSDIVSRYANKKLDDILNEVYELTDAGEKRFGEEFELNENYKKIKETCDGYSSLFTKEFIAEYNKRYAYTESEKEILEKEREEMLQASGLLDVD